MLIDPEFKTNTGDVASILAAISGGQIYPERIKAGVFRVGHWNFEFLIDKIVNQYPDGLYTCNLSADEREENHHYGSPIGVCDNVEQLLAAYPVLEQPGRTFCISLVRLRKDEQPPEGGWRWHKWGPYIGTQNRRYEYLHDEPEVEEVFTYHIYEIE